jgi:diguanylate cyclase (GGDEF)-like protein
VLIAATAFPLALLPLGVPSNAKLVTLAAVFFVIAAGLTLLPSTRSLLSSDDTLPDQRWWLRPLAAQVPVLFWCLTVATLQASGGGARAGYAPLLILPIVAQAVIGTRRDLIGSLLLTTLTLLLPVFVVGPPRYPRSEIRESVLWLISSAGAGLVIEQLVRASREKQAAVSAVAQLTRELDETPDVGRAIANGAVRIIGADVALLHEPAGPAGLARLGWAVSGAELATRSEARVEAPAPPDNVAADSGPGRVLAAREPSFSLGEVDPTADLLDAWLGAREVTSVLHVRATRHWRRHVVLTLGWRQIGVSAMHDVLPIAELLANEAVAAFDRADLVSGLASDAAHDALTGLPNRRAWDKVLTTEVSRARRSRQPLAVVLLDLDHFKAFNDTHGHVAGDSLLHDAAQAWVSDLRDTDMLARWGGEEFGLLLPNTHVEVAVDVVERLRAETPGDQTVSAGLAMFHPQADATSLTDAADRALYAAKQAGRNRLAIARVDGNGDGVGAGVVS